MAGKRERRAVTPLEIENPERDLRGFDRAPDSPPASPDIEDTTGELEELRARIESARKLRPKGDDLHCYGCWRRGRDATLRHVEGIGEG